MGMRLEAFQLRVVGVTARVATKDRPGQQRLAPQGDEPLWIKIPGVQ